MKLRSTQLRAILELDSEAAAPLLLGWRLSRKTNDGLVQLKIVETEAYHQTDPASHSYRGLTARTTPMFKSGGTIYVYFTYGMHYALNIVTGPKGIGQAVLLRAAEPLSGIEIMQKYRDLKDINKLANGPGKLAQALGVNSTALSGRELSGSTIRLLKPRKWVQPEQIVASPRIGITQAKDIPWRFYIKDSPFLSKRGA